MGKGVPGSLLLMDKILLTLRTLNYGNYGIFLIMGNAGFCPSAVPWDFATFCKSPMKAYTYLWLVGNGRMVVIVVIIVPIPPFPTNPKGKYRTSWRFWIVATVPTLLFRSQHEQLTQHVHIRQMSPRPESPKDTLPLF